MLLSRTSLPGDSWITEAVGRRNGEVYGVADDNYIYQWDNFTWINVPGWLIHVTVGPAGVGSQKYSQILERTGTNWVNLSGSLKQIDAGGDEYIAGISPSNGIYCTEHVTDLLNNSAPWVNVIGTLKYYSCGLYGCWGISDTYTIFYRSGITPTSCQGDSWIQVNGSLTMIEVGTDGSVYGVDIDGNVWRRDGISPNNSTGTSWTQLDLCAKYKHVSYDAGYLWLLTLEGSIIQCTTT
ncbi:hypothetical protein GDO86_012256 [Hymenochirus boettgeri]|uniref:Uncharacterized protein n=1 Tax=Hymenochirus boettgeri TaxID=247094 RepID=A0A8T2IRZ7_9PIPI|nr:hypothetical protein GDO86_012256 [Hymenochirus boettgeri]